MKRTASCLAGFIPRHISAGTVLTFLNLFSVRLFHGTRLKHFSLNQSLWPELEQKVMEGPFLERQHLLGGMVLGNEKARINSCEVIAAYNALKLLKKEICFPGLLTEFEEAGLVLGGRFGTAPGRIQRVLENHGCDTILLRENELSEKKLRSLQGSFPAFLLTAYNDREDIMAMIHTMCITGDGFLVLNGGLTGEKHFSLEEAFAAVNGGRIKPISLICVRDAAAGFRNAS